VNPDSKKDMMQSGEFGSLGEVLGNGGGSKCDDQYEAPLYASVCSALLGVTSYVQYSVKKNLGK
jgi:hypothetical protein